MQCTMSCMWNIRANQRQIMLERNLGQTYKLDYITVVTTASSALVKHQEDFTLMVPRTDVYYVPDTVRPIYFLSDREDLQGQFSLPPNMAETLVNAFVQVCGRKYLASKLSHSKTNGFQLGKIQYVQDNITETAGTISHADYVSSKVALHFNVNYWRPFWVATFLQASILSCSAAPVAQPITQSFTCPLCIHQPAE